MASARPSLVSTGARRPGGGGFALLSPAFLDELRDRTSLSSLIARTVKLTRAGNEYKANCPFHNERTPSFWVNDDKGFYHCFGCSAHGDAIRWLTEGQGLGFIEAVKELADAAGMEMPAPDPAMQARVEKAAGLHDVTEAAARWFTEQLGGIEGASARAYLEKRGISAATARTYAIGLAPDSRGKLKTALAHLGQDKLIETGLLISVEDKEPYDRFRGRLMIPIRDPKGRVIAFGGRILGDGEPKYLNSPDTPLFDKGRTLFNLDRAGPVARKAGRLIVVEGYLDVIALDQAGIGEAVAPLGTALTEAQLERLWKLVDHPLLCFDGDKAGQKAAIRAAERALPLLRPGKSLRFAVLPAGQDPDDVVRAGGAAGFEAAIANAQPLEAVLYRAELAKGDMARPEMRAQLRAGLDALAASCADRIVADEFKRSFKDLFYGDFGWKKPDRDALKGFILATGPAQAPDLARLNVRALLYGLTHYPSVVADRLEQIAAIPIAHPQLKAWRDMLVDHAIAHPALDVAGLQAILEADGPPEIQRHDICSDLRFGFTATGADPAEAIRRLDGLVRLLAEEAELDGELAHLDKAVVADAGGARYEAIESARQLVRERKSSLREFGYGLGGGEQDGM